MYVIITIKLEEVQKQTLSIRMQINYNERKLKFANYSPKVSLYSMYISYVRNKRDDCCRYNKASLIKNQQFACQFIYDYYYFCNTY